MNNNRRRKETNAFYPRKLTMGMLKEIIAAITIKWDELIHNFNQCLLCSNNTNNKVGLCHTCYQDLPTVNELFKKNLLLTPNIHQHVSHQHFDCLCSLGAYQWPYNQWINQLKYQQHFELADILAKLLISHFPELLASKNTEIMSVPIHYSRWQERGYNQSQLIAKKVTQYAQLPAPKNYLVRTRATEKQVGKTGVERRRNIKNAFTLLPNKLNNKITLPAHIILIDDVITTGSTVNEIARILKKHHVKTVTVLTIAIAIDKISFK